MALQPPFDSFLALDKQTLGPPTSPSQDAVNHVPDQPSIPLIDSEVRRFLEAELSTEDLNKMYNWLWLCNLKESKRVDPLHQQVLKKREIVPSEDPALHLVWFKDNVFIKPMPPALLNFDFWTQYLAGCERHFDRTVALGFLRSYGFLIRHRSDLAVALDKGLVPDNVEWLDWERFIGPIRNLGDRDVAKRYHFGQLRLSRLNILIRFLRPRGPQDMGNNRHYYTAHWYTAAYLRQFIEPGLFVFASMSLSLSAMQVILTLPDEPETRVWVKNSSMISSTFWGFCAMVVVSQTLGAFLIIVGPIIYMLAQQVYGYQQKKRFDRSNDRVEKKDLEIP